MSADDAPAGSACGTDALSPGPPHAHMSAPSVNIVIILVANMIPFSPIRLVEHCQTIADCGRLSYPGLLGPPRFPCFSGIDDRQRRYGDGAGDAKKLVSPFRAAQEFDPGWRYAIDTGQLPCNIPVGLAVSRWRRGANSKVIAFPAQDFAPAAARLHVYRYGDRSFVVIGAIQNVTGRKLCRKISAALRMTMANIGETSSPPIGGMNRRKGLSTGSASDPAIALIGL